MLSLWTDTAALRLVEAGNIRELAKLGSRPAASQLRLPRMLTIYVDADACPVKVGV